MSISDLFAKLRRGKPRTRKLALIGLGIWAATALLAFLWPLAKPPQPTVAQQGIAAQESSGPSQEDLSSFLVSTRWGRSFAELQQRQAEASRGKQLSPELREMGFVGFLAVPERTSILLVTEDGTVQRFDIGDELPDGRTLATADDNRIRLSGAHAQTQELLLFPEIGQGAGAA